MEFLYFSCKPIRLTMRIEKIVEVVGTTLLAVKYHEDKKDVLTTLIDTWRNPVQTADFFRKRSALLNAFAPYAQHTVRSAGLQTVAEALQIKSQILAAARIGCLEPPFKPYHRQGLQIGKLGMFSEKKYQGFDQGIGWCRLYGVKLEPNTFIIVGGGIKLVKRTSDCPILEAQAARMMMVVKYLEDLGVHDIDGLEDLLQED